MKRIGEEKLKQIVNEYPKSSQQQLEEHEIALRKYCHVDGCKSWYECPKWHELCSKHLQLDTAIAWRAAEILRGIDMQFQHNIVNTEDLIDVVLLLNIQLGTVQHLKSLVGFHYRKYPELCELLWKVIFEIKGLERAIRDAVMSYTNESEIRILQKASNLT